MNSRAGREVWITGMGAVSAAGGDVRATRESFWAGRREAKFTLPFESSVACPTFQVEAELPVLLGRWNKSRTLRLAMKAVREALGEAGIEAFEEGERVGVCLGTTVACQLNNVAFYDAYRRGTNPAMEPVWDFLSANVARAVGEMLGVKGPRMTVVNACSSGTDAIGIAAGWIWAGLCEVAIAGGADELNRVPVAGFWSLGVMSSEVCRPFDKERSGLNLGEGAGVVLLESAAHARRRGKAATLAVAGFGNACDGHHLTAPHPEGRGLEAAIRKAFEEAEIGAEQIGFINAHGTATQENDKVEAKVIGRVFGAVPFGSTKGYTGHTLGAAGGLEAVFAGMGLKEGWMPGSVGFENGADGMEAVPVRERTEVRGEYAMSVSLAFGGNNAAVIVRRVG